MRIKQQITPSNPAPSLTSDEEPPGVVLQPENPFESQEAVRIWARCASQRGRYEVVIKLKNGHLIKGSLLPLPGFYDASVPRYLTKTSLFNWKPRAGKALRSHDD